MIQKTYKEDFQKLQIIANPNNVFSNFFYYVRKDKNIAELKKLILNMAYKNFSDNNVRVDIITSMFEDNLKAFNTVLSHLRQQLLIKNSRIYHKNGQEIIICCRTLPDHQGEAFVDYISYIPIVSKYIELIELYNNNKIKDTKSFNVLKNEIKDYIEKIYKYKEKRRMLGIQIINNTIEKDCKSIQKTTQSLKQIFNSFENSKKNIKSNALLTIKTKIKATLGNIDPKLKEAIIKEIIEHIENDYVKHPSIFYPFIQSLSSRYFIENKINDVVVIILAEKDNY